MTFSEVHLAGEAVVAFVDGELGSVAQARALAHLGVCAECQRAVEAQQETSRLLAGAPDPALPAGLAGRLRKIPMTADLGDPDGSDVVLAVEGDDLVWGNRASLRSRPNPVPVPTGGRSRNPGRPDPGSARRDGRPASYPSAAGSGPTRRARRVLAGAVAGLAFGVCVATASTSVSAHTDTPDRNIVHDVNGGVVRPPITGELTGVRDLRAPDRDQGTFGRTGPDGFGPDRPQPVSHQAGPGRAEVGAPAQAEPVSRAGLR